VATIFIAEDDFCIRRVIALWLTRNGHEIVTAESGTKALEMIRQTQPDLIVTDVNMPGMSGLELLTAVRAESLNHRQAVILTSR